MMFSSMLLVATLFTGLPNGTIGSCNTSDQVCQDNTGVCTKPLFTFLDSLDGTNSQRKDIWNVLSYGHYCGASTKCVASNLDKGDKGLGPTPPEPCNDIDDACMKHDSCLDGLKSENGNPKIEFPLRCQCEFGIVRGMLGARTARAAGVDQGQLCDAEYYGLQILQVLKLKEEDFLAIPFCFLIFDNCMDEYPPEEYVDVIGYCNMLLSGLNSVLGN